MSILDIFSGLKRVLLTCSSLSVIAILLIFIALAWDYMKRGGIKDEEKKEKIKTTFLVAISIFLVSSVLAVFLPG